MIYNINNIKNKQWNITSLSTNWRTSSGAEVISSIK